MSLDKATVEKWGSPVDIQKSVKSYHRFKEVIEDKFKDYSKKIYLQGSYGNHTNIKDGSDIDVVVEFSSEITEIQNLLDWFYDEIQGASNFSFTKGHKTIKYEGSADYDKADIVPCVTYGEGILIYDHKLNKTIYNCPLKHKELGETKNKLTNGQYKSIVRVLKNARNNLQDVTLQNMPSYQIECLAYNVSNYNYTDNLYFSYCSIVTDLYFKSKLSLLDNLTEPGTGQLLFSDQQSIKKAKLFIEAIRNQLG